MDFYHFSRKAAHALQLWLVSLIKTDLFQFLVFCGLGAIFEDLKPALRPNPLLNEKIQKQNEY